VRFSFIAFLFVVMGAMLVSATGRNEADAASGSNEVEAALVLKPDLKNGLRVFAVCAACHSPEGWGVSDGSIPVIAGQLRTVIIKQLADIRAGNRNVPEMFPFAMPKALGGVQSLADVAAYISRLPMPAENHTGPGTNLDYGKSLYRTHCLRCHGKNGEGNDEKFYPRIQGQHYAYLFRQFTHIRDGQRRNANPEMVAQIKDLSPGGMAAVLDYVSRLKPARDRVAPRGWKNPDFKKN